MGRESVPSDRSQWTRPSATPAPSTAPNPSLPYESLPNGTAQYLLF